MTRVTLGFAGPFGLFRDADVPCVFDAEDIAAKPGIYIWTIPTKFGELAYYVGETGVSFKERVMQHLAAQLGGLYRVYDPEKLREGVLDPVWRGWYGPEPQRDLSVFLANVEQFSATNAAYLRQVRLYLAPEGWPSELRRPLERALAEWIRDDKDAPVTGFYEEGVRYQGAPLPSAMTISVSGADGLYWPADTDVMRRA